MLLLAAVPSTVGASGHCDATVTPGDSIQDAVYDATPGETICVEGGEYEENVEINESITLEANGSVRLYSSTSTLGDGLVITADNVTVDGFTVEDYWRAVYAEDTADTVLTNVTVNDTADGIVLINTTSTTISGTVVSNTSNGISAHTKGASSGGDLQIRETTVRKTDGGIRVIADDQSTHRNVTLDTIVVSDTTDGVSIESNQSASLSNVSLTTIAVNDNSVGMAVRATNGGSLSDIRGDELLVNNNTQTGVAVGSSGTGSTVSDVRFNQSIYNETSGPGLGIEVRNGGTTSNLTVNESLVESNRDGVSFDLSDGSLRDVSVRRNLIANNTNGLNVTTHGGTSYENVSIRENLVNESAVGILADPAADLSREDGFWLTRNLIRGNTAGVVNQNASTVLDARLNYWGATDGPSSAGAEPLQDPNAKAFADGSGDSVSEGSTSGVSNVRFAPAVGGKSTCGDTPIRVGDELVDLVPDETVETDVGNEAISGPLTDFVGLCAWDRAVLPLRAGTDSAPTRVRLPDIAIRQDGVDISLNRQHLAVYDESEPIPFRFQSTDGTANMDMFANEDAQLVVARVTGEGSGNLSFDVNATDESATFDSSGLEVVDIKDVQLNSTGELPGEVQFTPQDDGTYVAILASRTTGDGFEQSGSGNLSFDVHEDDLTIIGVEGVAVQSAASTATPQTSVVPVGDSVTFEVNADLGKSSDVNHTLLLYHEDTFVNSVVTITDHDLTFGDDLSVVSGNVTVEVDPPNAPAQTLEVEASDIFSGDVVIVDNVDAINSSVANTTAGDQSDLTLQTGSNFRLGDYRYVHIAVADNGEFSTSDGLVEVGAPDFAVTNAEIA
jgi:hypothetical protein